MYQCVQTWVDCLRHKQSSPHQGPKKLAEPLKVFPTHTQRKHERFSENINISHTSMLWFIHHVLSVKPKSDYLSFALTTCLWGGLAKTCSIITYIWCDFLMCLICFYVVKALAKFYNEIQREGLDVGLVSRFMNTKCTQTLILKPTTPVQIQVGASKRPKFALDMSEHQNQNDQMCDKHR